jgi:hypothetical protein
VPTTIQIRRNHLTKPIAWKGSTWAVNNILELKNAQDVVIEGNLLEYNWSAAQTGYSVLFTPRFHAGAFERHRTCCRHHVHDDAHDLGRVVRVERRRECRLAVGILRQRCGLHDHFREGFGRDRERHAERNDHGRWAAADRAAVRQEEEVGGPHGPAAVRSFTAPRPVLRT